MTGLPPGILPLRCPFPFHLPSWQTSGQSSLSFPWAWRSPPLFVFLPGQVKKKESSLYCFPNFKRQGMRESNSHQRFWRPLSYHLTNPLRESLTIFYIISWPDLSTSFDSYFYTPTPAAAAPPDLLWKVPHNNRCTLRDSGSQRAKQPQTPETAPQSVAPQGIQRCNDTYCKCRQICGNRYSYVKLKMVFFFPMSGFLSSVQNNSFHCLL